MSPDLNIFREFVPLLFLDSRFVNYLKNDTENVSILNVLFHIEHKRQLDIQ